MIFTNIISILLVLFVIINYKFFNFRALVINRAVIATATLYFLIFTGFLYGISTEGVFNDLEKKLSFLVLPISISLIKIDKEDIQRILAIFFFFGFFFTSIAFFISTYNFLDTGDYNSIINHNLSNNIGLHSTYLSMYLLFSLSYPLLYIKRLKGSTNRFFVVLISACLLIYILLLSVRIIWLLLFVLLIFEGVKLFKKNKRHLSFSIVGVLLFSAVIIYNVNPLKERFNELVNYNSEYNTSAVWKPNTKEVWGGRGIRLLIWQSCVDLIKQAPFKGYGSSIEVQKQLDKIYIKNKIGPLLFLINNRGKVFNPHNQYLEEVLKFGTIVGLSFIVFLWVFIHRFYKTKNKVGMLFLIIITGVSLTETILELNKGIIFFSFFFPVLYSCFGSQINQKFNELIQKKMRIYFCFPVSGPNNGVKIISNHILNNLLTDNSLSIITVDTAQAKGFSSFGKFSTRKIVDTLNILSKLINVKRVDLIYLNLTPKGFAFCRDICMILISKIKGAKVTVHIHSNGLENNINLITKYLLKNVKIIVINKLQYEKLKELRPNVFLVKNALPDFFNRSPFKYKPIENKIKLLFFSNLSKEKGIYRLVSIIRIIAESNLNCEVNIYGGILDKVNSQIFSKLKVKHDFINYFGPITDEKEKYYIFTQNNFLLFLSDINYEVSPLVYIESLMSGLPIITTKQVVSDGIVAQNAGFHISEDANELLTILQDYNMETTNKEELKLTSRNLYLKNYSFDSFMSQIKTIILK